MKELSTQEKAKTYDGEQNSVNTELDELVIQLEEAIGTSPHSRETIKDFFQKAVQKYMNCLKIANVEIGALVEENYRLKEKQGEQSPVVIIPKFRVGDVIRLKNSCTEYTIKGISDGHYYGDGFSFNIVGCDRDYELVKQKSADEIEPKFKVGDKIRKKAPRSFDTDMEVARIEKDYYICNHIGKFSSEVVPFSAESCYELIEQKASNEVKPKFHEGDWIVFNGLSLFIKEVVPGYYRTVSRTGIPNSYDWDIDNIARRWTIDDAKPGDVLAAHECLVLFREIDGLNIRCYCTYHFMNNPSFYVDTLQNKEAFHPATKEQEDQLKKAMADAGYTFDFDKKEFKKITQKSANKVEPKFHEGEWIITDKKHIWYVDETPETTSYLYRLINQYGNVEVAEFEVVDNAARLWTIQDAKDGDVICYKDEISLYKHDIKNCTKQGANFGGFVYYCCYDGKRFIMNNLYSLVEQDKMDIHPASKEQCDRLLSKMREAGYKLDADKKKPKFKVGDWV